MATQAIILKAETLRSRAFSDISSAYQAVGGSFVNQIRIFHLQNLTDGEVLWSMDGINDQGVLAAGSFLLLDVTANKTLDQGEFLSIGTTLNVRTEAVLSSGNIYLSVFYGSRN